MCAKHDPVAWWHLDDEVLQVVAARPAHLGCAEAPQGAARRRTRVRGRPLPPAAQAEHRRSDREKHGRHENPSPNNEVGVRPHGTPQVTELGSGDDDEDAETDDEIARHAGRPVAPSGAAGLPAAKPGTALKPAKARAGKGGSADDDDEFGDVAQILRRHGIS